MANSTNKHRIALVGTGHRGTGMWGKELLEGWGDTVEMVGICDTNPLRLRRARDTMGAQQAPVYADVDQMFAEVRPAARHRDDARRHPCRHHRQGARSRHRRRHRKADGDHRREGAAHPGSRAPHRPARRRHLQLPLSRRPPRASRNCCSSRPIGEVTSVDFHWYLDTQARRRLFPPLARLREAFRQPLRPQGDAPFRPAELVSRRRSRSEVFARGDAPTTTAATARSAASAAGPARTPAYCEYYFDMGERSLAGDALRGARRRRTAMSATPACSARTSTSPTR